MAAEWAVGPPVGRPSKADPRRAQGPRSEWVVELVGRQVKCMKLVLIHAIRCPSVRPRRTTHRECHLAFPSPHNIRQSPGAPASASSYGRFVQLAALSHDSHAMHTLNSAACEGIPQLANKCTDANVALPEPGVCADWMANLYRPQLVRPDRHQSVTEKRPPRDTTLSTSVKNHDFRHRFERRFQGQ